MAEMSKGKLIIADLDGTLLARWAPGDYEPRPGPALPWVKATGLPVVILTNQGGLALRWAGLPWAQKYPGLDTTLRRIRAGMEWSGAVLALATVNHRKQYATARGRLLAALGRLLLPLPVASGVYISLNPDFRKPSPGGLLWLCRQMGVPPEEVVFVGDDEKDDRGVARAAGVRFVDAKRLVCKAQGG